jgi:monoamine oxidase
MHKPSPISLSTEVTSIDSKGGRFIVNMQRGKEQVAVSCSQVILALPAAAMQQLQTASPALNALKNPRAGELQRNIESVISMRLCKINLYYNQAWWRDQIEGNVPNIENGGSFTSLPLGSAYAFDPMVVGDVTGPAALTIYCDFNNTNFWETLQQVGPKFTSPLQEEYNHTRPQVMFPASERVVKEATKQLKELFQMISVPWPVLTSFRLWSGEEQFGYAYHQWARFANDRDVMKTIASPVKNIFVCNEAFSDDQGWVNGSLRSANIVLKEYFDLSPLPPMTEPLPPGASG